MSDPMIFPTDREPSWQECALFEMNRFYGEHEPGPEDLPREVGAPFLLKRQNARQAILLLHGFLEAPSTLKETAEALFQQGFTVYVPRLDGHGNTPEALEKTEVIHWIDTLDRSLSIATSCASETVVMGIGLGALLALSLAANRPNQIKGLILQHPKGCFGAGSLFQARFLHGWNTIVSALFLRWFVKSQIKGSPLSQNSLYDTCPVRAVLSMQRLMKSAQKGAARIACPTLLLEEQKDNAPSCLKRLPKEITSRAPLTNFQELSHNISGWMSTL